MSKQMVGKLLLIVGFALNVIRVLWLQSYDVNNLILWTALVMIVIGFILVPNYSAKKEMKQE